MGIFVAYLLPALLFFLGIHYRRSRLVTFLFMLYFWILMGLNTNTPDYISYENIFMNPDIVGNLEWGFYALCNLLRNVGINYQGFRLIYAAAYALLTIATAKRLTKNINFVLALFLLWPFVPFVSGLRVAMAMMIVCYSVPFLLENGKKGVVKYVTGILIACLFHLASLFFLVYIFARKKHTVIQYIAIVGAVFIGSIFISSSSVAAFIMRSFTNTKLIKWLSINASAGAVHLNIMGIIVNVFFVIAFAVSVTTLSNYLLKSTSRRFIVDDNSSSNLAYSKRIILYKNISINTLLTIPGYIISSEYQRFLFGILIVYYAVFADFRYTNVRMQANQKLLYQMLCVLLIALLGGLYIYSITSHDVFATLKDNLLFQ